MWGAIRKGMPEFVMGLAFVGIGAAAMWSLWLKADRAGQLADGLVAGIGWIGLLPMGFMFCGLGLLVSGFQEARRARWVHGVLAARGGATGPRRLLRRRSDESSVFIAAGFGLCFGAAAVRIGGMAWDKPSAMILVMAVLFGLVWLLTGMWFVYSLLRALGPRTRLVLAAPTVRPGESAVLTYALGGPRFVVGGTIALVGLEEATSMKGKTRTVDRREFHRTQLAALHDGAHSGNVTVRVPAGSMHSLYAAHNKVVWAIAIQARVASRWWPDVEEEFDLPVEPALEVAT